MLWSICLYKRHFSGCCNKMSLTIFLLDRLSCHVTHLAWTDRNIPWRSMTPWRWSSAQKKWRNYQQSCQYVYQCRRPKKNSSNCLLVKWAAIAVCFARQIVSRPRTESTRECNWPVRDATVNYRGHVIYIWSDLIGWTHAVRTGWFYHISTTKWCWDWMVTLWWPRGSHCCAMQSQKAVSAYL